MRSNRTLRVLTYMFAVLFLLLSTLPLQAQGPVVEERNVLAHESFLASDALNGRGSATRDEWIAAVYIGSQLRQFGIEPAGDKDETGKTGYVQVVPLTVQKFTASPVLNAGSFTFTHGKEMAVLRTGSAKISGPLQKLATGATVQKNAVVYIHLTENSSAVSVRQQLSAPMQAGAAMVIVADSTQIRQRFNAAAGQLPELPESIGSGDSNGILDPGIVILNDAATKQFDSLADGTAITLKGEVSKAVQSYTYNAMGVLRGTDPKLSAEVILLTAHLDHLGQNPNLPGDNIYNGADDDASGVTAVLEFARALGSSIKPRRTVFFICFGSEEKGGFGAQYFLSHPPMPLATIAANLEFEMIGQADAAVKPDELWLTGWERSNLGPELAKQGAKLVADPHPDQQFFFRSDNITLARRGVVAQTVSSFGLHKQYHQPDDDLMHLDVKHMTAAINSMIKPVLWLVNSDFKPAWNPNGKP